MSTVTIKQFGGEDKLLEAIVKKTKDKTVAVGPGDDAAVLDLGLSSLFLASADSLVEGDHFSLAYFRPIEIGAKAAESSLSDIAAMGGTAKYMLVCLALKKNTSIAFARSLYRGLYNRCLHHNVSLIGGDTVKSTKMSLSVTVIGTVKKELLCLRSHAKPGQLIKVTGKLGASTAGFYLLKRKYSGHHFVKKKHLEPRCRLELAPKIAPHAGAMQDISDGLAEEVRHIARHSKVGAKIFKNRIPFEKAVYHSARTLNLSAFDLALYGGEDYELVYTIDKNKQDLAPGIVVGEITSEKKLLLVDEESGTEEPITKRGFQHF